MVLILSLATPKFFFVLLYKKKNLAFSFLAFGIHQWRLVEVSKANIDR